MKIQIENLNAQMRGVKLTLHQRADALIEFNKLVEYTENLESKVEKLPLASINNCGLLNIANEILKYEYEPTLRQDWTLTKKGKMTILHRAKSKEELINYVVSHYC